MFKFNVFFVFLVVFASALAEPSPECIVTSFSQLATVVVTCTEIIIRNLTVPAGVEAQFHLLNGATLTFEGTTTFETFTYPEWGSYLMTFRGTNITVQGAPDSVLDGQGAFYWDGIGDKGYPKPYFIGITVTNSTLKNINLLNCPHHCTLISNSNGVTLTDWDIDCSYGDDRGGHNTDGFDVLSGNNIVIKDSKVVNQDDCVAVNQGFNMHFSGLYCYGTHGISLSVGFSKTSYFENTVRNITYSNCTVVNSINGIHIKTHNDGGLGEITDITYENIILKDIINFGISIQEDYADGGSTGIVVGNVPITNLKFSNITGTLLDTSTNSTGVYVFCAEGACSDWSWSNISIEEGVDPSWCNFEPDGYNC